MVTIVLTERALQDLRDIRDYSLEEWGQTATDKYLDDFEAAIGRLSEMPVLLRQEPQIASGLYFYRVRKHFLVCDMFADTVFVLTVIHCNMDLPARLADLQPTLTAEVELLRRKLQEQKAPE